MKIMFDGRELTPIVALADDTVAPVENCLLLLVTDDQKQSLIDGKSTTVPLQFNLSDCVRLVYDRSHTGHTIEVRTLSDEDQTRVVFRQKQQA